MYVDFVAWGSFRGDQELRRLLPVNESGSKGEEKSEAGQSQDSYGEFGCMRESGVIPKSQVPFDIYVKVKNLRIMCYIFCLFPVPNPFPCPRNNSKIAINYIMDTRTWRTMSQR